MKIVLEILAWVLGGTAVIGAAAVLGVCVYIAFARLHGVNPFL
jgi:hypothetical protein